ncbi:M57 family metalloprotease [Aquimarina sp. AD10]|uniref:M57 family metalloprotease n=1 Tax=Aquimarina sp. AD10 TaxID=1714849 RepID=UPI0011C46D08|nr:M57 family metalloprotease [Aquimarina sp. AD10]
MKTLKLKKSSCPFNRELFLRFNLKLGLIFMCLFIFSCDSEEINESIEQIKQPTKEQLDKLDKMGVNNKNVAIEEITLLDGSKEEYFITEDIRIPINEIESYPDLEPLENGDKQYRTSNLVSSANRTINILGYTGDGFELTSKMQTALRWAVFNYNRLDTSLIFNLTFGVDYGRADMVVYKYGTTLAGGQAEFPTNSGKPGKFIQIFAGTDSFSTNLVEHVITHEIGHGIGFRHQDWFDRQSCGTITTSAPPVESPAIWIPETPIATNEDSIMLACFNGTEDGEFSDSDVVALEILY